MLKTIELVAIPYYLCEVMQCHYMYTSICNLYFNMYEDMYVISSIKACHVLHSLSRSVRPCEPIIC